MQELTPENGMRESEEHAAKSKTPATGPRDADGALGDPGACARAEQRLKESEARFASVFRSNPVAAAISAAADGRIVDANAEFERITGLAREDCLGRTAVDLDLWVDSQERTELMHRARAEGAVHGFECRLRHRTGAVRSILMSAEFIRIEGAEFMLTMALDVSWRKRAEEALSASEVQLSNALKMSRAGHWEYDVAGDTFTFTDNFYGIFGTTVEEVGGYQMASSEYARRFCHPDDAAMVARETRAAIEATDPNHARQLEHRILKANGEVGHITVRFFIVKDGQGRTVKTFGVSQDITERKRAEEERERLQAQLLQAQKMESIGRLAGGVAHDFNNLLMGIVGYTELCRDEVEQGHPIHQWLDEIAAESQRSATLVRQLLAFARKQVVEPRPLDLNEEIGGMLKMLARLIGERIEMTWSPAANLRLVSADSAHIDQVVANLCLNAADAIAGSGRVAIATRNVEVDDGSDAGMEGMKPGAYVLLSVSDTGCGMDVETLARIFEPFFTTKELGRGTGLGLATVYGIVQQSGGHIFIDSAPGEGTTVRIYLLALDAASPRATHRARFEALPRGRETILVVDDEPGVRVTIAAHLERLGYTALTADSPEAAIRQAREHPGAIDLLLTDMVMPGMSGVELRSRLLSEWPATKSILMTGYATLEVAERIGSTGEGMLLMKPITMRDLAVAIRSVLSSGFSKGE